MDRGAVLVAGCDATEAEAVALVRQARASAVITDRELLPTSWSRTPLNDGALMFRLDDPADLSPDYGESVVLKLTSGSTDLPKAAVAAEAHLINDGRHIIEAMGLRATDINFTCIPLSHSYAIGNVIMPLIWQGTATALRQSFNPAQFVQEVAASRATVFPGVPFMFDRLKASHVDRLPDCLRLLITAGARADIETVVWFRRQLERKVHSFYGTSETGGISYDDTDDIADPLHVGHPMPETRVSLHDVEPDACGGRIFVQGNAICYGYAQGAALGSASRFNGRFLTGDLGRFDGNGRLLLTGRASMLVNVAGRKVDPSEVERALLALPGIADARVLGMPCDVRGQAVVAFVVRRDAALTTLAIRRRCATLLSPYKIPRRFVFLDRFPVDARGKIDRRALEQLAMDRR
jgi:long-chain acyl-CoA synthetase